MDATTCFYLLMEITCCETGFSFEYSVSIYLFIQRDVNKSRWKGPPVFIYLWKSLVVRQGFHLNIQYLFMYLFKAMSTKAGGRDHLFLFTYGNHLLLHMVFVLLFSIYLFIYSKWCQQKHVEVMTFIDLCKSLVLTHGFRLVVAVQSAPTRFYSSISLARNWYIHEM